MLMKKFAVIVAGGNGQRMGSLIPKQFLLLKQKPLLWYSINSFLKAYADLEIILVLPEEHLERGELLRSSFTALDRIRIIQGGATRFHSVQKGLSLVAEDSIVFVHDGVRCLVSNDLIVRCYEQALSKGSAIPAVAATDSIRMVNKEGTVVANRNDVRLIQTPQTFKSEILLPAFKKEYHSSFTDEATVVEASGNRIFLVEGEYQNIKITRPIDLMIAEKILDDTLFFE